eukprot:PITA_32121
MGFQKSDANPNLYFIMVREDPIILLLYVDDLFITGEERLIQHCKRDLALEFDMTDMGLMHYFLGLEVWQEDGHIFLGQGKYEGDILRRFRMEDCKPVATPMITNWKKLQGTVDYGLDSIQGDGVRLTICTDSDWAGSASDQKSTCGSCFRLGSTVVSWFNKKQRSVALSSAKVEYIAAIQANYEVVWLHKLLYGLFGQRLRPTTIYCDNHSCIKLIENLVFHDQSKHIEIKYHFVQGWVQGGAVKFEYISIEE